MSFFFNGMSSWEFVGFNGISPATNGKPDLIGVTVNPIGGMERINRD